MELDAFKGQDLTNSRSTQPSQILIIKDSRFYGIKDVILNMSRKDAKKSCKELLKPCAIKSSSLHKMKKTFLLSIARK